MVAGATARPSLQIIAVCSKTCGIRQIRVRAFNKKGPGQWADIAETTDLIGKYSILILLYYTKVMVTLICGTQSL